MSKKWFIAISCIYPAAVLAGYIQVSPISLELSPSKLIDSFSLENLSPKDPVIFQGHVLSWQQQGNKDIYLPTHDLLAVPPMTAEILPGRKQVIRVALRNPVKMNSPKELAYIIQLKEMVKPIRFSVTGMHTVESGLQMALGFVLPVYVQPKGPIFRAVGWKVQAAGNNSLKIGIVNKGNVHSSISKLMVFKSADFRALNLRKLQEDLNNAKKAPSVSAKALVVQEVAAAILPGQEHQWVLKLSKDHPLPKDITVLALTTQGPLINATSLVPQ